MAIDNTVIRAWREAGCEERCEFLAHLRGMYSLAMLEDFWRRYPDGSPGIKETEIS